MCLDHIGIARGIQSIIEEQNKLKDVRINRRRNIVAIELKVTDENMMQMLLHSRKFGKWEVKCFQPNRKILYTLLLLTLILI